MKKEMAERLHGYMTLLAKCGARQKAMDDSAKGGTRKNLKNPCGTTKWKKEENQTNNGDASKGKGGKPYGNPPAQSKAAKTYDCKKGWERGKVGDKKKKGKGKESGKWKDSIKGKGKEGKKEEK